MAQIPSMEDMLSAGVHFGHQSSRWHPKMGAFIHGTRQGIHVIDLEKTAEQLQKAVDQVTKIVSGGGTVLFVGTKSQTKGYVKSAAEKCGMPYVTNRWLGGTLTNFDEISKSLKRMATLKRQMETGELAKKYNKKEQLIFSREIEDLEYRFGGISDLKKVPEALLVFDVRNEMTAIKEARRSGVKVIALCDTNVNPDVADTVVPGNDDAVRSIELITNTFAEAIYQAKKSARPSVGKEISMKKVAIK